LIRIKFFRVRPGHHPVVSERDRRSVALAAGLGLALMLAVIVAAAGIRLETGIPGLRVVHRVAASLEVLVVLWLGWIAWRRPAVLLAFALTAILSVVGIIGGQQPPPAIAAVNLLGGLALAGTFAWIAGGGNRAPTPIFVLLGIQLGLGAWLSIVERTGMALPIHGLLAVALTATLVWIARGRSVLLVLALAAPIAGFTTLHLEYSALAALVHAITAALLVVSLAAWLDPHQGNARRGRHPAGDE
jgi:hypothetical protein